jgi:hypothetical protein
MGPSQTEILASKLPNELCAFSSRQLLFLQPTAERSSINSWLPMPR